MKRKYLYCELKVFISVGGAKCRKCHHTREGEPFVGKAYAYSVSKPRIDYTCWRCCRDAESTLLIKQKWPLAFRKFSCPGGYRLEWAPGVKELVGEHHEA